MESTTFDAAAVAEKFNLTEAEAGWVSRAVARGGDPEQAALSIRSQRVGPAAEATWRPLPEATAAELEPEEPVFDGSVVDDEDVEELD